MAKKSGKSQRQLVRDWWRKCTCKSLIVFDGSHLKLKVVIDSAASFGVDIVRIELLVFSANHASSLNRSIVGYQQYALSHPYLLEDLAHNLGARREHLLYRAFCVTDGKKPFKTSSVARYETAPEVVFVFTGQGAQWAGMAQRLLEDFAELGMT